MAFLQIAVALIFFVNKVLVLVGRRVGWLAGAIAASLGTYYFYRIGMNVYAVLDLGLIVLAMYGYFAGKQRNLHVENVIRIATFVAMSAISFFAFNGKLTGIEFVSSASLLWGTFLLVRGKTNLGWGVSILAHTTAAYLGYDRGQEIFAHFQVASVVVSIIGATKK